MGPSWYKEAQLQLLNTTVRLNSDIKSVNNYAVKVASLLDSASGEMTFQRYIRYEKENFIGDLISKGNVDKAIEYLKFETIPPADILLENAENSKVDIVEKGFGNSPGARNLTIQNGVLELLNIEGLSPFIRIALCRIFTVNDDIFRHVDIFSIKMATALNEIEDEKQRIFVFGYIVEIISASEMAEDKKAYITQLYQTLHADIYEELYQYVDCEDVDLKLPSLKVKDEILKKNHQKEEGKNWFEVFNSKRFENLNKSSRSDLANFGVEAFKKERISIWHSNWSTPSNVAKDNLKELFSDVDDTLINLYPFVRNYGVETWTVVDQLIWFLEGKLSSEQGERILADISDHFELLIRPEKSIFQKYEWFNKSVDQSNTSDKKVLNFIIWLLNHPLEWIRNGAFKVIESLFEFLPDELISELIKESISDTAVVSCETSVELLCRLACGSSEKIIKVFNEDPELVSLISNVNHLTIFKKYLELGEKLKSHGYSDLFNSLHMSLPDDIEGDSEVALEEDMLDPIVYEIEALNELQILNREFCENILYRIREKCKPLTWSEYQKTDMYMKRSYNEERFYSGGYSELARYALNKAIVSRVGKNNIEDIYNAINSI